MDPIISINPKIMHGSPCFAGTRVLIESFFDHLRAGYTVDEFLEQFPSVRKEVALSLVEEMKIAISDIGSH